MILETKRLYLREMCESDYNSLCKILQDKDAMYAYEGIFSNEEVQNWLNKQLNNYRTHGFGLWAVILKETHKMIGQCGVTIQNWNGKNLLEIGYLLNKDYWHKGYATESAIACKEYAFNNLNTNKVYSIIRDTNISSQNVAKRNGMAICDKWIKNYRGVNMPYFVFSVRRYT